MVASLTELDMYSQTLGLHTHSEEGDLGLHWASPVSSEQVKRNTGSVASSDFITF